MKYMVNPPEMLKRQINLDISGGLSQNICYKDINS